MAHPSFFSPFQRSTRLQKTEEEGGKKKKKERNCGAADSTPVTVQCRQQAPSLGMGHRGQQPLPTPVLCKVLQKTQPRLSRTSPLLLELRGTMLGLRGLHRGDAAQHLWCQPHRLQPVMPATSRWRWSESPAGQRPMDRNVLPSPHRAGGGASSTCAGRGLEGRSGN